MHIQHRRDNYVISTDPALVDVPFVHDYLCNHSYWAKGIPFATVARSIGHSMPFGVYVDAAAPSPLRQVGFARVISDRATFAYIGDVFIIEDFRGRGLSKWLMETILAHPELQGLRRWMLLTADAHGLYRQFGFTASAKPERVMERAFPNIYRGEPATSGTEHGAAEPQPKAGTQR
jgi:GNAT superfamily N-acetyltransferase